MPPEKDQRATQPPHDKEAEKGVLGSMLRDNKLAADVARIPARRGLLRLRSSKNL